MTIEDEEDIPYKDLPIGDGYVMRRQWMSGCAIFKGDSRISGWWHTDEEIASMFAELHSEYEKLTNLPGGT